MAPSSVPRRDLSMLHEPADDRHGRDDRQHDDVSARRRRSRRGRHAVGERRYEGQDADHASTTRTTTTSATAARRLVPRPGEREAASSRRASTPVLSPSVPRCRPGPDVDQQQHHDRPDRHRQQEPEAVKQPDRCRRRSACASACRVELPLRHPGVGVILANRLWGCSRSAVAEARRAHVGRRNDVWWTAPVPTR